MTARLASFLQIRGGEGIKVAFVAALFAFTQAAEGIGGNAADSLFFIRFGVNFLPYMFMALGALTFIITLLYSAGLIRVPQRVYFTVILLGFAAVLLVERMALVSGLPPLYPVLWLSVNIVNAILGTFIWYIAGEVCDTRQAKRLFSLFASAGILGGVVGNLATGLLAQTLGTENLLFFYAALLIVSWWLTLEILRRFFHAPAKHNLGESFWSDLRVGYDYVRASPLLLLTAYSSVLFSILYFSISFPFSQAASRAFPNEAELAGFLGLFSSVATLITFFVSLLLANRFYARFGIVNAVLMLPLIYLGSFVLWSGSFVLTTAVIARLAQLVILGGVASTAWSALFNVVPPDRRGQVLGFDAGVPSQLGVVLSGVLLILGERVLTTDQIFIMGMLVAAACGYIIWRMRRAYGDALVHALRAGRFEVFSAGPHAFAPFHGNAGALHAVLKALQDTKTSTRRIAVEILGRLNEPEAVPALVQATADTDAQVRLAAVRALAHPPADPPVVQALSARLEDADPAVRAGALEAIAQVEPAPNPGMLTSVENLLRDPDMGVSAGAAVALARLGQPQAAFPRLNALLCDERPQVRVLALDAFARMDGQLAAESQTDAQTSLDRVIAAAHEPSPMVRRAACQALGAIPGPATLQALADCLGDSDPTVRRAAGDALKSRNGEAVPFLLDALTRGNEQAQEAALDALPSGDSHLLEPISTYAHRTIGQTRVWHDLSRAIPASGRATRLVHELLESREAQSQVRLVKAVALLGQPEAMRLVARSFRSRNAENRAEAIEALETLGDKRLAREIIPLLDDAPGPGSGHALSTAQALAQLLVDPDSWTRALAARAVGELKPGELAPTLRAMMDSDPAPLPREAAGTALIELGEKLPMETLQTVSSLERILLLREVPLFAELSPDDLKQIADVTREQWYPDAAVLCKEGDEGNEMYVIVSGTVRVSRDSGGTAKVLARRGAGESIGEMAIIESAPRSATLTAEGEVRVLVLAADAFKAILRDRPEVSLAVLRVLSRRLRE